MTKFLVKIYNFIWLGKRKIWGLIFVAVVFLIFSTAFSWVKAQTDNELPQEALRELEGSEIFTCNEIPVGKYFIDTKDHADRMLSLFAQIARSSRQIYTTAKAFVNLSKECNSGNCAANCESPYGLCFGLCEKTCLLSGPGYPACVEGCKGLCDVLPQGCVAVAPSFGDQCKYPACVAECYENCTNEGVLGYPGCVRQCKQDCKADELPECNLVNLGCFAVNWFGFKVAHPCVPLDKDVILGIIPGVVTLPNLPDKLYEDAKKAAEDFKSAFKEAELLQEALGELQRQESKIKGQFALWFRERHTSWLLDCYQLKDQQIITQQIDECPFEGNNLFHCK